MSTAVEAVKAQVVKNEGTKTINDLIFSYANEFSKVLPKHITPERICRVALTNYKLNPKLAECTSTSLIAALFQSAQLGLEPGVSGQAYLIPYFNSKTRKMEVQFQIGYKGLVELFYRGSNASTISVEKVCKNDTFDYELGSEGFIKHKPPLTNRGEVIAYYAIATFKNGDKIFKIMSKEECLEHGKTHSKMFDKKTQSFTGVWATETDAMCMKTVLIQLMKVVPKSIEIQQALAYDGTTKNKVSVDMMSVNDVTDWETEKGSDNE